MHILIMGIYMEMDYLELLVFYLIMKSCDAFDFVPVSLT